jgi:hypothetical protein
MIHHGDGVSLQAEPMKTGPESQAAEVVDDKLKAAKTNDLAEGEATTRQTTTVGNDGERR